MEEIINHIVDTVSSMGQLGALFGCLVILVESILPIIPLMVFITLNFVVFGNFIGFIMSWIFTVLGCLISYFIFKNGFGNKFEYLTQDKEKINKYKKSIKDMSTVKLAIIIAIPFTPAFVVNIVAGLLKIDFKKFLIALLIGKISLIYFWGYVGTSFIDSFSNPIILIKIILMLVIVYIISKVINKFFKI